MAAEERVASSFAVRGRSDTVTSAGDIEQLEILVGSYQRIHDLHRRRWVDIGVEFTDDQLKIPTESMGIRDVRIRFVVGPNGPSHVEFVPPDFVHPIVMAAAVGYGRIVKFAKEQQSSQSVLTASRSTIDPYFL